MELVYHQILLQYKAKQMLMFVTEIGFKQNPSFKPPIPTYLSSLLGS
jgi:hypothetical protein